MPKIVREEIDQLNNMISITIEKSDYLKEFNSELSKYRKEASLKGFRKGKTPTSVLKKMFGKQVLAEVVHKTLQDELFKYLEDENINFLGQPIPTEDSEALDLNPREMEDYEFKFDVGLAPEFTLDGLAPIHSYTKYVLAVTDEMIDEELKNLQKRFGERIQPEDDIQENDIVTFDAKEMEGDALKEEGHEAEFSLLVNNISNEEIKEQLLTLKKGDRLSVNIFELEGETEDYARKYLLKLEDDDQEVNERFELEITEVGRVVDAELDQEFFDTAFGEGNVASEEEAREELKKGIQGSYEGQAKALLSRDLQDRLLELNELEFPEAFLKRWMLTTNEETTEEAIEKDFDNFKKNLSWTLIRNKITQQFELKIEMVDIQKRAAIQMQSMFGGQQLPSGLMESFMERILSDQQQVERLAEEAMTDKVFDRALEEVNIAEKEVSKEEFDNILDEARAAANMAQLQLEEEE
ncbi:MAG: trigger factor [Bacteroidota bacterium]